MVTKIDYVTLGLSHQCAVTAEVVTGHRRPSHYCRHAAVDRCRLTPSPYWSIRHAYAFACCRFRHAVSHHRRFSSTGFQSRLLPPELDILACLMDAVNADAQQLAIVRCHGLPATPPLPMSFGSISILLSFAVTITTPSSSIRQWIFGPPRHAINATLMISAVISLSCH